MRPHRIGSSYSHRDRNNIRIVSTIIQRLATEYYDDKFTLSVTVTRNDGTRYRPWDNERIRAKVYNEYVGDLAIELQERFGGRISPTMFRHLSQIIFNRRSAWRDGNSIGNVRGYVAGLVEGLWDMFFYDTTNENPYDEDSS